MKLELEKAFRTILQDDRRGDNPIPDPLRFSYILLDKEDIFRDIEKKIEEGEYKVKPLMTIEVPKNNFTIRPMARPEIEDWIVYQALIDHLVPKVVPKISRKCYSILNLKTRKGVIDSWKKFDEKSRYLYDSGYLYTVVTDISGYFENIDLKELREKLINYIDEMDDKESRAIIDFLYQKLLIPWSSGRIEGFGLPQGPSASKFLGDIYLDNFDREMDSENGYIRYMDDIIVFCNSEINAKKALIKIVKSLRKYKLSINAKKTKILQGKEIEIELFDPKKTTLDSIQQVINSKEESKIQVIVPLLVKEIFKQGFFLKNPFAKRHLNFALFRLSILKNSGIDFDEEKVINLILNNFIEKPHHSDSFCHFLTSFSKNKKISKFLIQFLFSKNNIYEWQELHVLRALLEMKISADKRFLEKLNQRFLDRNKNPAIRALYCLLVGRYGKNQDRELLKDEFELSDKNEVRKSIVLAIQQLGEASRNDFYNKKARRKLWPKSFISYVKNLEKAMYFRPYDKIMINIVKPEIFYEEPEPEILDEGFGISSWYLGR